MRIGALRTRERGTFVHPVPPGCKAFGGERTEPTISFRGTDSLVNVHERGLLNRDQLDLRNEHRPCPAPYKYPVS